MPGSSSPRGRTTAHAARASSKWRHEALIGSWPRLAGWLDADRAGLRIHRRLTEDAGEWDDRGRPENDFLLTGTRLAVATEWAAAHHGDLNDVEREYLRASIGAAEEMQRRQEEAQRREEESRLAELLRIRLQRRGLAAAAVVFLAIAALAGWQWKEAHREGRRIGRERQGATRGS